MRKNKEVFAYNGVGMCLVAIARIKHAAQRGRMPRGVPSRTGWIPLSLQRRLTGATRIWLMNGK